MSNNITIPSFRTINKTIQECFITNHEKRLYTWISISSILSAKNTRLAIVAIVAIVAETFNPSFVYNFRQIYQFTSHSPFPSSTPPQRSKTRNKANANDHQIVHSHQLRRLFGRNGRNGQIARGGCVGFYSTTLWFIEFYRTTIYDIFFLNNIKNVRTKTTLAIHHTGFDFPCTFAHLYNGSDIPNLRYNEIRMICLSLHHRTKLKDSGFSKQRIMKEFFFNTIQDFNDFIGVETLHPLVSVARVEKASLIQEAVHHYGLYALFLKENKGCKLSYGRTE